MTDKTPTAISAWSDPFGETPDGCLISRHTLVNQSGMKVTFIDFGATLVDLFVPDRNGKIEDVSQGFDSFPRYVANKMYFGSTVGRYANRIGHSRFELEGELHQLSANNGLHSLHGGKGGFSHQVWTPDPVSESERSICFRRTSPDGEEGYPGTVEVSANYQLLDSNELRIAYRATTDRPTPISFTNHTYLNLGGPDSTSILGHVVTINADYYTPVGEGRIPTGDILPVEGTMFDFRQPMEIGARIGPPDREGGYDHNYVLKKEYSDGRPEWAATVYDPVSGRELQIFTDQPGIQFYSGNMLAGGDLGKGERDYPIHGALAFEPQQFPDSMNQPNFPQSILRPGETFKGEIWYRFGAR